MATRKVELTIDVPWSVSNADLRQYIIDSVTRWGDPFHPDDHLHNTVEVSLIRFIENKKKEVV